MTPLTLLLLAALCAPLYLYAQDDSDADIESLLESIAQDTDVSPQLDAVDYFAVRPLPLRRATTRELLLLPGFSVATARAIIRLARTDTVQHFEQIAAALALSDEQVHLLRLCTTLAPAATPITASYRVRYRSRLDATRGTATGAFAGSPLALYQRFSAAFPHVELSIATDKDAGERSIADFAGGYVSGSLGSTRIILGDYAVQSGMGTVLGRPFGSRKGGDVLSPAVHSRTSVVPQRSAMEQHFFRGMALEHAFPVAGSDTLLAAVWFSSLRLAATVDTATGIATALDTDGYFRTESEIARRGALREQAAGSTTEWQSERFNLGLSALGLRYSAPIYSSARSVFRGEEGVLLSAHGTASFDRTGAAAEIARDASGHFGVRAGVEHTIGRLRCALSFRSFPAEFRSPFGSSFGESARPSNETGLYTGWNWRSSSRLSFSCYGDLYRTAGPTFTVPVPIRGLDLFGELRCAVSRNTHVLVRIHREDKTDAASDSASRRDIFRNIRFSTRAEVSHALSDSLRVRFRCEAVHRSLGRERNTETGVLCFLEARYRAGRRLSVHSRLALYHTDSFHSALWAYEYTVPGTMSSPAHYGSGMRWTAFVQYRPTPAFTASIFAGITSKNNVETLGSGLMEIQGNTDRQVAVQIDIAL